MAGNNHTKRLDALLDRVPQMQARAKAVQQQRGGEVAQQPTPTGVQMQLPIWPDSVRGVPNGFLRTALFGAIAKGRRRYIDGESLAAVEGIEVTYTGQRLDQGDLDVWEAVLHAVRFQDLGSQCRVTSYALLKLIGKPDSGKNRQTLQKRITRLRGGTLTLRQGPYTYIGGLIQEAFKDDETQEWVIELNPKLLRLYGSDQFTMVDWSVRRALHGKPLAQWIHGFYSSHAAPFPIRIETLHKLCGSEAAEIWKFNQTLRKALDDVQAAHESNRQGFSYEVQGDLVHVEKQGQATQRRHLAKKRAARAAPAGRYRTSR